VSVPGGETKQSALHLEWAAARIVVIGGLILAVAVAGYFIYRNQQAERAAAQAAAPHKLDPKLLARAELAVCTAELAQAINIGIVPTYGQLASPNLVRGPVPKRFICEAGTHLTRYFIAADLLCNNLTDAHCVSIYRIATKDGQLLYDRPE